jgi:protein-S-isoprenylcysteine O-methyltransferase Ste14
MLPNNVLWVRAVFAVTVVVWLILELRQAQNYRPEAKAADRGSRLAIRLATIVAVFGSLLIRKAFPSAKIRPLELAEWLVPVFMWCGIGLRFWSFHTLGRYFTFTVQTSDDQPVISAGPYRVIRHPSYAGVLLAVTGIGFFVGNWAELALIVVAVFCGLAYRISVEERALSQDLGGRYQAYAESRKRLIPFLW